MRRVKFLNNARNDAVWGVLVRGQNDLKVAVRWMVQVEVDLHFLGRVHRRLN